jgi:hypothetical protein
MRIPILLAAVLAFSAFLPLPAQEARRNGTITNSYLVEYRFHDGGDASTATDRRYTLMVNGEHKASFKSGSRTPTVSSTFEQANGASTITTQYSYLDLGVNIECTLQELDSRVEVHTALDLSSLADNTPAAAAGAARNPTLKQTKLDASATLQIGKSSMVASIADPASNRTLQVTVLVTPAN